MSKAVTNGRSKTAVNGNGNGELTEEQLQEIKADMLEYGKSLGLDDRTAQLTATIAVHGVPYEAKE